VAGSHQFLGGLCRK